MHAHVHSQFGRASNVLSVIFEDGINPKTASVIYPQVHLCVAVCRIAL